jgi:hypothetical protein
MFFSDVFDTKIVDNQRERDWLCFMFPQAGSIVTFLITMREETLLKELVGEDTCLGKAPHGAPHFEVNKSI